jgi:hypothetical protein
MEAAKTVAGVHDQVELAPVGVLGEDPLVGQRQAGQLVVEALDELAQAVHRRAGPREGGGELLVHDTHGGVDVREPVPGPPGQRAAKHQPPDVRVGLAERQQPPQQALLGGEPGGQFLDPACPVMTHTAA